MRGPVRSIALVLALVLGATFVSAGAGGCAGRQQQSGRSPTTAKYIAGGALALVLVVGVMALIGLAVDCEGPGGNCNDPPRDQLP